jgi:hypothetical protein
MSLKEKNIEFKASNFGFKRNSGKARKLYGYFN